MVTVELFGIVRQRAGVGRVELEVRAAQVPLRDIMLDLARRFPDLDTLCFDRGRLRPGYVFNLGGDRFLRAADEPIADGSELLLLSADAGG